MPADVPRSGAAGWGARGWLIRGCWCAQGCCGWRWCPFRARAPSQRSPATGNAPCGSVLQWVTSHCNGKGNRCAEFAPLPPPLFFSYENGASYNLKEVLTDKYPRTPAGSSPSKHWTARGLECCSFTETE